MNLSLKYRPQHFSDVVDQEVIVRVLQKQLEIQQIKNCYLFTGPSGTGKTTLARIFANTLNNNCGQPLEIDGASNNGVDNVREIIELANQRSLDSEYKVIIIDECHMITTAGWNAFLKCIEEPPKYTIFIFCTTDPQKIPETILNRVQQFNLSSIKSSSIETRLNYICEQEGFINYKDSCNYISKICNGCLRNAIMMLDQCSSYSKDISIDNVIKVTGTVIYSDMISLTNGLIDGDEAKVISIVESIYSQGKSLKVFIDNYLDFVLELNKYCLFKDINMTQIPSFLEYAKTNDDTNNIKYTTSINDNITWFNKLADAILNIKNVIKYDTSYKSTVEVMLLNITRGL